jgi:lysophospholipase L1-like esterase
MTASPVHIFSSLADEDFSGTRTARGKHGRYFAAAHPRHLGIMWMLYIFLALLLLPPAAVVALYASRIRFSRSIAARTVPAQSSPAACRRTIVVAGDSTAFGVGALPEHSTAGRLAAAFPHARVVNVAKSGARVGHVVHQLARVTEQLARSGCRKVDFVLMHACANDVIEFRDVATFEADLRAAIAMARQLSDNVVLMPGNNFSASPFFLRVLSPLVTRHAFRLHAVVQRVTTELGVTFVDLFRDPSEDPFVKEPRRYYCPDGLHPSGEGYGIWFSALVGAVPLKTLLAPGRRRR